MKFPFFFLEKDGFIKSSKDLQEKEKSMRKMIENLKEKNTLTAQEKNVFLLFKKRKFEEILALLKKEPNMINIKDEVFFYNFFQFFKELIKFIFP